MTISGHTKPYHNNQAWTTLIIKSISLLYCCACGASKSKVRQIKSSLFLHVASLAPQLAIIFLPIHVNLFKSMIQYEVPCTQHQQRGHITYIHYFLLSHTYTISYCHIHTLFLIVTFIHSLNETTVLNMGNFSAQKNNKYAMAIENWEMHMKIESARVAIFLFVLNLLSWHHQLWGQRVVKVENNVHCIRWVI